MATALKFLIFYTIFLGFTYFLLISGSPQIFANSTYTGYNVTYANESASMSALEIFMSASTDYIWLHLLLIMPLLIGMSYIVMTWIRGT